MSTLGNMPQTDATCTDCGTVRRVRIWPDDELRAVGNGGECGCGSRSFE